MRCTYSLRLSYWKYKRCLHLPQTSASAHTTRSFGSAQFYRTHSVITFTPGVDWNAWVAGDCLTPLADVEKIGAVERCHPSANRAFYHTDPRGQPN